MTYYYMGGMIKGNRISEKIRNSRNRVAISIGAIISIVITIAYEYVIIGTHMITNSPEYHHDSPFVILSVFLILQFFGVLHERYTGNIVLMVLSASTLGVYVLHGHIESFLRRMIIAENFLELLLLMLITVILSFCFSIIMGRIPVIRALVSIKTNLKI